MGERKGQNKYYPPDFDYKVHKSLAGYHGQHPLRERARKLDRGILIIRFEMPYNIWCDGCNNHIGMGVRYNAEKSKDGMYYTTPIYKFRMKCHLCDNHFEIKTDPANHDYVIMSGARRKEQRWDPHENEQIVPEDRVTQKQMALNAMYKLEHGVDDQTKGTSKQSAIAQILDHKERNKDDFALNQLARKQFREAKKSQNTQKQMDDDIRKKYGLSMNLPKEHPDDVRMSKLLKFATTEATEEHKPSAKSHLLFRSSKLNDSASPSSTSLTKKDVSVKRVQEIASSEVVKKRAEAFLPSDHVITTPSQNSFLNHIVLSQKQSSQSVENSSSDDTCQLDKNIHQQNDDNNLHVSDSNIIEDFSVVLNDSSVKNSSLSALCNYYTSSNDEGSISD